MIYLIILLILLITSKANFLDDREAEVLELADQIKNLYENSRCNSTIRDCKKCSYDGKYVEPPGVTCVAKTEFPAPDETCKCGDNKYTKSIKISLTHSVITVPEV